MVKRNFIPAVPRLETDFQFECLTFVSSGQAVLTTALIFATSECHEAIRGGSSCLKELEEKFTSYCVENSRVLKEANGSLRNTLASIIVQDIYMRDVVNELLRRDVVTEFDFFWNSRPRSVMMKVYVCTL